MTRRLFIPLAAAPVAAAVARPQAKVPDRGPRLDLELVKEFVIAGHGNLERTKELLQRQPALLNAAWDWGGGDWETPLGGASHMGRRDIAEFLIGSGARADIFTAAMLGNLDLVKAWIAVSPALADARGPHGIPLIVHAQKGGDAADGVVRYLDSLRRPVPTP